MRAGLTGWAWPTGWGWHGSPRANILTPLSGWPSCCLQMSLHGCLLGLMQLSCRDAIKISTCWVPPGGRRRWGWWHLPPFLPALEESQELVGAGEQQGLGVIINGEGLHPGIAKKW